MLEIVKEGNFTAGTLNIEELIDGYFPSKSIDPKNLSTASVNRNVRTGYLISPFSIFHVPSRVRAFYVYTELCRGRARGVRST